MIGPLDHTLEGIEVHERLKGLAESIAIEHAIEQTDDPPGHYVEYLTTRLFDELSDAVRKTDVMTVEEFRTLLEAAA